MTKDPHIKKTLQAMRANHIPAESSGLWAIELEKCPPHISFGAGIATALYRATAAKLQNGGDLVMIDHRLELEKHLQFVLSARGNVLVTGLGLGCVVRGLLEQSQVDRITVIERDRHVIKLVGHTLAPSVRLIHSDALEWVKSTTETFDYAWHDLWSDTDKDEPHLQETHAKLMVAMTRKAKYQGAWAFPRMLKRIWPGFIG